MAKNDNLTDFLTDVADAIRAKKNTSAAINPQDFSAEIASIETAGGGEEGGGGGGAGAVNFKDYDGTILHSYTKDVFLALNEMPELPTRAGLTCQGWNYNMEDAKAYVEENGKLDVGATYITDDGKTRLYIRIASEGRMNVPLYFSQTLANGVTIDWGDGSATETLSGTGNRNTTHTYAEIGEYTISLNPSSGCALGFGMGSSSYCVMGSTGTSGSVYCSMLQAVEIGKNVTNIAGYAFSNCGSLASVVIPNGVIIGTYAFNGCGSLASVVIPNGSAINTYAFQNCYALASVVISNSVQVIGANAFFGCYSLASVVIPNSVKNIGNYAFQNCHSLASVVIPNSVTVIGNYAFSSCYALASVVISNSVKNIGSNVFSGCYSLTSVVIPNGVASIGTYAFSSCYSLTSVVIPNSVTSIGTYAFNACRSLASVVIPNSVTSIGTHAFFGCYSLASVVIPESATSISERMLQTCYSLASVVIPNSVTSISAYAFFSCSGMAFCDFSNHTSVPTLSNANAFNSIASDCKIVVPDALYDEWIAATNWSSMASKIVKASEFNG